MFHFFFLNDPTDQPILSFFFFFFLSSTLPIDDQPTLSLDGKLTQESGLFSETKLYFQGNITTFTNTTSRHIVHDFLSVPFELFDVG